MMAVASVTFVEFDTKDFDDINGRWNKWITKLDRYFVHKGEQRKENQ